MKRNVIHELASWKDGGAKKPLWITGIRGTGKTYLALEFAKSFFDGFLYANLEAEPELRRLFEESRQSKDTGNEYSRFDEVLRFFFQIADNSNIKLLCILDEITSCEAAFSLMEEYFANDNKQSSLFSYIFISSLPMKAPISKKEYECLKVTPMTFDEFITAAGYEWYADIIRAHYSNMKRIPEIVHQDLLNFFWDYLHVGGMPAVINRYLGSEGQNNTFEIQSMLQVQNITALLRSVSESEQYNISRIISSLCPQLMKNNRKFQYSLLRKGATASDYHDAIKTVVENETAIMCKKVGLETSFKLYYPDVGLLYADILAQKSHYCEEEINRILLENYVMQSLHSKGNVSFWESASKAKIDAVIETKNGVIPLEILDKNSKHSKSLLSYISQNKPSYSYRLSFDPFTLIGDIIYLPFYAAFCIDN